MKLLQIHFFLLTWFTTPVSAIWAYLIVASLKVAISFPSKENQQLLSEIKTSISTLNNYSIASLSGSYLQDDYPDLSNVLNITSSILAKTDLSANGVDSLLKANTNPSASIDIIF